MRRPKGIKTKKSVAKRFKITARGKVLRMHAGKRHLLATKSPKRRRKLGTAGVVGPEDARAFSNYWHKESLPFIGLPDPKASVLRLYGQEVNLFKLGRMPAQVLIDKAGIARFVHYGHSMSDIPKNEEILALGDEINDRTADG